MPEGPFSQICARLILSNVYNSFIINVDCFVAYWLLAAFINIFQCNEHVVK